MADLFTVAEAAQFLRLSVSTIYHLTSAREIPFYKIGQRCLLRRDDLEQWLLERRVAPIAKAAKELE